MFKYNIGKLPQPTMQLVIRNTDIHDQDQKSPYMFRWVEQKGRI